MCRSPPEGGRASGPRSGARPSQEAGDAVQLPLKATLPRPEGRPKASCTANSCRPRRIRQPEAHAGGCAVDIRLPDSRRVKQEWLDLVRVVHVLTSLVSSLDGNSRTLLRAVLDGVVAAAEPAMSLWRFSPQHWEQTWPRPGQTRFPFRWPQNAHFAMEANCEWRRGSLPEESCPEGYTRKISLPR